MRSKQKTSNSGDSKSKEVSIVKVVVFRIQWIWIQTTAFSSLISVSILPYWLIDWFGLKLLEMCRWAQLCARANPKIWTPPTCSLSLPLPPLPTLPLPPPPLLPPPLTDRRAGSSSARRRRRVRTCWQPPRQQNAFRRVQNLAAAAAAEEEEEGPSGSCCRVKCWAGKCDASLTSVLRIRIRDLGWKKFGSGIREPR